MLLWLTGLNEVVLLEDLGGCSQMVAGAGIIGRLNWVERPRWLLYFHVWYLSLLCGFSHQQNSLGFLYGTHTHPHFTVRKGNLQKGKYSIPPPPTKDKIIKKTKLSYYKLNVPVIRNKTQLNDLQMYYICHPQNKRNCNKRNKRN